VALFLIIAAGLSTMVLAPALQSTRIDPIRTIRGEVSRTVSSTRPVPRASRHSSAASGTGPKRARAVAPASAGVMPSAMRCRVSRSM
jgi:hypothetical protein